MTYDLITNNCNNFSNEVTNFLLGESIPASIVELPQRVFSSPMGQMLVSRGAGVSPAVRDGPPH